MGAELFVLEGAKIMLQAYFSYMRLQGKTPEEIEALYQSEKSKFAKNNPDDLEDTALD